MKNCSDNYKKLCYDEMEETPKIPLNLMRAKKNRSCQRLMYILQSTNVMSLHLMQSHFKWHHICHMSDQAVFSYKTAFQWCVRHSHVTSRKAENPNFHSMK